MRTPLRLCISLTNHQILVTFDGDRNEREDALALCPDLAGLLNDAMSNIRRHYGNEKMPTRGEPARQAMLAMAARLRDRIANDERAIDLDVTVRAEYDRDVVTTERVRA